MARNEIGGTVQTRLGSLIEVVLSTLVGLAIGVLSQMYIFPRYGIEVSLVTNLEIGLWFTAIGIVRSYLIRRLFNRNSNSPA